MARTLLDTITEQEQKEEMAKATGSEETKKPKSMVKTTVDKIITKDGDKDKQISAKVNGNIYNQFTQINKLQGISNNSALNMLITKYVRENRGILDDESGI